MFEGDGMTKDFAYSHGTAHSTPQARWTLGTAHPPAAVGRNAMRRRAGHDSLKPVDTMF